MVFQNYSLMPWLNVLDNIALGLNFAKMPKNLAINDCFRILRYDWNERLFKSHTSRVIRSYFVTHSVDEAVFLADRIILMDTKPGKIKKEIFIDIDRIRDRANPKYAKLMAELLNELEEGNK